MNPARGWMRKPSARSSATLNEVAEGRSVILITHRLTGVERLDRIWRLSAGKAIAAAA